MLNCPWSQGSSVAELRLTPRFCEFHVWAYMSSLLHHNTSTPQDLNYSDYSLKPSLTVPVIPILSILHWFNSLVTAFTVQSSLVQTIFTNFWLCFGTQHTMRGVKIEMDSPDLKLETHAHLTLLKGMYGNFLSRWTKCYIKYCACVFVCTHTYIYSKSTAWAVWAVCGHWCIHA